MIFRNRTGSQIAILGVLGCAVVCALVFRADLLELPARTHAVSTAAQLPASGHATEPFTTPSLTSVDPVAEPPATAPTMTQARTSIASAERAALLSDVYKDLLASLDLSESQIHPFLILAASAREARIRRALQIEDASGEFMNEDPKVIDDALLSLLGYERFQKYESYERSFESRSEVRGFESELLIAGLSLAQQQRDELLAMLVEERSLMPDVPIIRPERIPVGQRQAVETYYDHIKQRAEFKLTPQQYAVFALRVERDKQRLMSPLQ